MERTKPKVIKWFEKIEDPLKKEIKKKYPDGFADHLITYTDHEGRIFSALPYETEDRIYLLKMPLVAPTNNSDDSDDSDDSSDDNYDRMEESTDELVEEDSDSDDDY